MFLLLCGPTQRLKLPLLGYHLSICHHRCWRRCHCLLDCSAVILLLSLLLYCQATAALISPISALSRPSAVPVALPQLRSWLTCSCGTTSVAIGGQQPAPVELQDFCACQSGQRSSSEASVALQPDVLLSLPHLLQRLYHQCLCCLHFTRSALPTTDGYQRMTRKHHWRGSFYWV